MSSTHHARLVDEPAPISVGAAAPAAVIDLRLPLSVVIPAYNESERIPALLTQLRDHLTARDHEAEIIVVDDGSVDDTHAVASAHLEGWAEARCFQLPVNRGKGAAVRHGVLEARGRNIIYMDADASTDIDHIDDIIAALDHAHVAIGSRAAHGAEVAKAPLTRTVMGRAYNGLARQLTGLSLRDTQCGFKGFRAPVAKLLFGLSTIDRFAFDIEVLHQADSMGFKIAEVPVRWAHVEGSKVRGLTDSFSMALDTYKATKGRGHTTITTLHVSGRTPEAEAAVASLPVRSVVRHCHDSLEILLPHGTRAPHDMAVRHLRDRGINAAVSTRSGFELARSVYVTRWQTTGEGPVEEATSVGQQVRYAGRRSLRKGKYLVGHDPVFLPLLVRATPMGAEKQVTSQTDLVVEGFPRSGNTFAVFALADASDGRLSVASHVHHPSQVKLAVRRGLPTLFVIREPLPCLASYLIAGPHGRAKEVLKEYVGYHRELLPYLDDVLVADFTEVTSDFGAVIGRLQERFDVDLPPFVHESDAEDRVLAAIESHHRQVHGADKSEWGVPRPSSWRSNLNERHRSALRSPELADLMAEAEHLRHLYLRQS